MITSLVWPLWVILTMLDSGVVGVSITSLAGELVLFTIASGELDVTTSTALHKAGVINIPPLGKLTLLVNIPKLANVDVMPGSDLDLLSSPGIVFDRFYIATDSILCTVLKGFPMTMLVAV